MLRAGVGAGPPRSRGGVAKRLGITERRVIRLERTGLSRLRSLTRSGNCVPPARTGTSTEGAVAPLAAAALTSASSSGGTRDGGGSAGKRGGDGSGSGSGNDDRGGTDTPGTPRNGGVAGIAQTNTPDSISLTIPLILVVLGLTGAAVITALRRRTDPALAIATDEPLPAPRPVWVPWRRSTMDGPRWTASPPPSAEDAGAWAAAPDAEPEPQPEPLHHDAWTPPEPRRKVH